MRYKQKKQRGAALLLVIMITAIMSIIMVLMLHQSKLDMKLSAMVKHRAQAELTLNSEQNKFLYQLTTTPLHLLGPENSSPEHMFEPIVANFSGQSAPFNSIEVSVQDISGLISLLPLDKKSLNSLLLANNLQDESLLAFYDQLDDWQDNDSLTRLSGKELGDYQGYPYFPSNMIIQSKEELAYILDKQTYENIKPYIVLYGDGYMNRQFTPEDLYSAASINNNSSSKEYTSFAGSSESGVNYPSGRYLIRLSYNDNGVSLGKQFLLIRGLGTFQPFFIANEQFF